MSFTQAARRSLGSASWKAVIARQQLPRSFLQCAKPRTMVSATTPLFEKRKIKVPSMGDSITEGTIVEWTAAVGQAVKEDDVVALIETDKVTVEIKAEMSGVISQHFVAVEETVEVGANLYELDTDIAATVNTFFSAGLTEQKSTPPPSPPPQPPTPEPVAAVEEEDESAHHRTPAIKFLGKEGWTHRLSAHEEEHETTTAAVAAAPVLSSSPPPPPTKSTSPAAPTLVIRADSKTIPPMYGRPRFTDAEMDALISGGAEAAPKVVKQSGGAKFSYI